MNSAKKWANRAKPVKIDEDLSPQVADLVAARDHDAATVVGQGLQGASDDELWPRVQHEGRWLITADKGFADLRRHPAGSHAGGDPAAGK